MVDQDSRGPADEQGGKMGPPTNPLAWLTPKASIFPIRIATNRSTPRIPASVSTVSSWALPVNRVSGRATPISPKMAPPIVEEFHLTTAAP